MLLFFVPTLFSQKKSELEQRRNALIKDIELTTLQIKKNRKNTSLALEELELINTQLKQRRQLLDILQKENEALKKSQSSIQDSLRLIQNKIEKQKKDYAVILNQAHISSRLKHPFSGMLEGVGLYESFKKRIYLGQLKTHVLRKSEQLSESKNLLHLKKEALEKNIRQQGINLESLKEEEKKINRQKENKNDLVAKLKKNTGLLDQKLEKKKRERKQINEAIEKLILAELSRKKKQNSNRNKVDLALSKKFENNKGKLPWPVANGVITSRFGRRAHPELRGVYIDNAGIDFLTRDGNGVQAVFSGTVVGATEIPGGQSMVIISHGDYFTVYSKLTEILVNTGQEISTGATIGRVGNPRDGAGNFHFEVWKGKEKNNPQLWLRN